MPAAPSPAEPVAASCPGGQRLEPACSPQEPRSSCEPQHPLHQAPTPLPSSSLVKPPNPAADPALLIPVARMTRKGSGWLVPCRLRQIDRCHPSHRVRAWGYSTGTPRAVQRSGCCSAGLLFPSPTTQSCGGAFALELPDPPERVMPRC